MTLTTAEAQALYRWLYRSPMPRGADYPLYREAMQKLETESTNPEKPNDGPSKRQDP